MFIACELQIRTNKAILTHPQQRSDTFSRRIYKVGHRQIYLKTKSVIRLLRANTLSICRLPHRFSITMEPHCSLKAAEHLFKNKGCYHHNANDRFGLKVIPGSFVMMLEDGYQGFVIRADGKQLP